MTTQTLLIKPSESDFVYFSINDAIQQVDSLLLKVVTAQEYTDQAANACLEAVKYHFAAPGQNRRAGATKPPASPHRPDRSCRPLAAMRCRLSDSAR